MVRPWRIDIKRSGWQWRKRSMPVAAELWIDSTRLGHATGLLEQVDDRLVFHSRQLTINVPNHPFRAKEGILECTMAGHRQVDVRLNGTMIMRIEFHALRESRGTTIVDILRRWATSSKRSTEPILPPPVTQQKHEGVGRFGSALPIIGGIGIGLLAGIAGLFASSLTVPLMICAGGFLLWYFTDNKAARRRELQERLATYQDVMGMLANTSAQTVEVDAPVRYRTGLEQNSNPAEEASAINTRT